MKKVTRWSPDTCDCVLEYEWDDSLPVENRVHTISKVVNACPHHGGTPVSHFNTVVEENTRKNFAFAEIQKLKPDATPDNYNWSFDEQRKLKVGILNLPIRAAEKAQLKANCNARFGAGKVEVI